MQKMPFLQLFGAFCAKQRKSACSFVQGASQKINGGSTLLPGNSSLRSLTNALYSSLRGLTNALYCSRQTLTAILQWLDFNRPLYYNGLTLTKELFVEPSNSCLLSLGSRQLQWHTQ